MSSLQEQVAQPSSLNRSQENFLRMPPLKPYCPRDGLDPLHGYLIYPLIGMVDMSPLPCTQIDELGNIDTTPLPCHYFEDTISWSTNMNYFQTNAINEMMVNESHTTLPHLIKSNLTDAEIVSDIVDNNQPLLLSNQSLDHFDDFVVLPNISLFSEIAHMSPFSKLAHMELY